MIQFETPKNQSSIIKVIGVGGGGGNAVNYMYELGINAVDFVVCNTDSQALALSKIPNKIQLGPHLTQGLGAGANPDIGRQAGEESVEDIEKILKVNTRMAFITAGMGGGTGTGAAPIIAKVCKELGILTVGIVTTPFAYEGPKRLKQAQEGIKTMREYVDTILVISNDKLRQQYGNLPFSQAFAKADNVLATAAKCITDLITVDGKVNLDFNDVQTVMKSGGAAILGSAQAEGEDRAKTAVVEALNSPLLNDSEIQGAQWILLNVNSPKGDYELTLDELEIIQAYVQEQAGNNCDIILGMGENADLEEKISVTIIATGFEQHEIQTKVPTPKYAEPTKIVVGLDQEDGSELVKVNAKKGFEKEKEDTLTPRLVDDDPTEEPTFTFRKAGQEEQPKQSTTKSSFALELPIDKQKQSDEDEKNEEAEESEDESLDIKLVVKPEVNEKPEEAYNREEAIQEEEEANHLSEIEKERQERFEAQKREVYERAERLRSMSINFKNKEVGDEIENIPAYVRKGVDLDNSSKDSSDEDYLSGYSVEKSRDGNPKNTIIRTINTFLNGKKPD